MQFSPEAAGLSPNAYGGGSPTGVAKKRSNSLPYDPVDPEYFFPTEEELNTEAVAYSKTPFGASFADDAPFAGETFESVSAEMGRVDSPRAQAASSLSDDRDERAARADARHQQRMHAQKEDLKFTTHPGLPGMDSRIVDAYYDSKALYAQRFKNKAFYNDIRERVANAHRRLQMTPTYREKMDIFDKLVLRHTVDAVEWKLNRMANAADAAEGGQRPIKRLEYELERAKQQACADESVYNREHALAQTWHVNRKADRAKAETDGAYASAAALSHQACEIQMRVASDAKLRWAVSGHRADRLKAQLHAAMQQAV